MNKRTVDTHDINYLEKTMDFIRDSLTEKKVSRPEMIKAELLAEESIITLLKNAPEDAKLLVSVNRSMGDISIVLSMEGESFDPNPAGGKVSEDLEDSEAEEVIRSVFLRAYGEKYKYSHKNKRNKIRILVEKAQRSTLLLTMIAMGLGLLFGFLLSSVFPEAGKTAVCTYVLQPVKTIFMNALKIVIAPVVFFSMVTCISQFKNLAELGKLAAKVLGVYLITTLIATALGFTIAMVIQPGEWGFALSTVQDPAAVNVDTNIDYSLLNTLVGIVPSNFLQPFLEANTLQLMFLAVLVGIAVGAIGEYSATLTGFFEACNSLFLTITTIIAKFIPVAVFCSVSLMIADVGGESFLSVVSGLGVQILTVILMICIYGVLVLVLGGRNPFWFFKNIREGMVTSFSLCSSSAAMPVNLRICKEKLKIPPRICNFSIPLGATVNMDGTCIFLSSFTVFLARAYGVQITGEMIFSLVLTIILLSLGAPGVPGCALVCLGVVLGQAGIPIEAMGLIIAIAPIADMFDTMNNTTGDMAATVIVDRWERGKTAKETTGS